MWKAAGNFDFYAVMCNLMRTDISPLAAHNPQKAREKHNLEFTSLVVSAQYGVDTATLIQLPAGISGEARAQLFHERLHYWQLLSSPFQQMRFVYFLERLRTAIANQGGVYQRICGQTAGAVDSKLLEYILAGYDADFNWYEIVPEQVRGFDRINHEKPTYQLFFLIPWGEKRASPAYGAGLSFESGIVHVPFTGITLLESAARISQLLYENKPLPQVNSLKTRADKLYLGCWEYWRRLHGHRYESERDLALAFLAAIDLAMLGDVLVADNFAGSEYEFEMKHISYRFGKLAFRMQGVAPLECKDEDVAGAVARFQDGFCAYTGWPAPATVAKNMAALLTRLLVFNTLTILPWEGITPARILYLLEAPFDDLTLEQIEPFWKILSNAHWGRAVDHLIGFRLLAMMLNACLYRIHHPGCFAVPHLYEQQLNREFPMPFILMDGIYYMDHVLETMETILDSQRPIHANALMLANECIQLIALAPLARKAQVKNTCGLIDPDTGPRCFYTSMGLGCPQFPLNEQESQLREKHQLHNWCHWKYAIINAGIAPKEDYEYWLPRWQEKNQQA